MTATLPDDWFIEETGERIILDKNKVAAEITRLQAILKRCMRGTSPVDLGDGQIIGLYQQEQAE